MNNNDILIRLRYTFDIKDANMLLIFELGGLTLTLEDLQVILKKQAPDTPRDQALSRENLEHFLNGFIISQRGVKLDKDGKALPATFDMTGDNLINNVTIKKIKIAMTYTTDHLQDFLNQAGKTVSTSELSAILRNKNHRNYKPAGDQMLRNLLKGMALDYRLNG
ncbi:hypothetical protein Hs30E_19100 [Lactococcus hodotermopsidis]|uniref:DUF1456 domain-containing protein n=1 Tax=Pseudolactococcus hodotermopsidis TaxID=2709157 RepID=A0A6A0BD55_9LACT|nr:DUF1456 family protein [Lactococcus hodotermopsidis]GFH43359.1 hypothetical protein Hs30E_19100 [Lactococcus hodotermopsidis]